ncbi:glycine betaine ABC transporter substrate-binding protein [Roseibium aggregatum]|uniref:ABC transporter substrate-binding protein n=1 Tax=Roseibium aggregatum TaxID=187304 RepID=UPI001F42B5F3|nr:glycine betaine ABC transporter substrate-binding protein [Roseibium aggregatum]
MRIGAAAIGLTIASFSCPAHAADVVIGVPAWPSAQVTAHIIADTLKDRLGIETELRERGTLTILSEVGRGNIQVHPEVWLPNLTDLVEKLAEQEKVLRLSPHGVAATQNICATRETLDQTGIKAVADLAKPEMAAKFDSDGDGKGEIWIGAPTWSSTEIEKIRAHSYGYDRTMTLLEMPEDVAMAGVDAAVSLGRPIVFYCYGPHHVFQLHDVVMLEEPPYDPSRWTLVKRAEDSAWLEKSHADTAWDASEFHVAYAASLETERPDAASFLSAIELGPEDITAMSYAVVVEGRPVEDVAKDWIAQNEDRIGEWTK